MPYLGVTPAAEFTSKDLNGEELILDADADTTITADTDDTIDIRIAGADDFQFTANTMSVLSGSTLNIDSGATIANSGTATGFGVSLANDGDNRVTTGTGSGGLNGEANLTFDGNMLYLSETANSNMTTGLTINQGASDDEIFALKSSDVAHGLTSVFETDTYASFTKNNATTGGLLVNTILDSSASVNPVMKFRQFSYYGSTVKTTDGEGQFEIQGAQHDNAGTITDMGANRNVFAIRAMVGGAYRTVFIVDEDGDFLYDGADGGAFDKYDDALLCRSFDLDRGAKGIVKGAWDKFATENTKALTDAGILGEVDPDNPEHYNELGELSKPLVNAAQLQRLHNGAIWQQRAMFETLKEVAEELLPGFANKLNERLESKNLPALPV